MPSPLQTIPRGAPRFTDASGIVHVGLDPDQFEVLTQRVSTATVVGDSHYVDWKDERGVRHRATRADSPFFAQTAMRYLQENARRNTPILYQLARANLDQVDIHAFAVNLVKFSNADVSEPFEKLICACKKHSWTPQQVVNLLNALMHRAGHDHKALRHNLEELGKSLDEWQNYKKLHKTWTDDHVYALIFKIIESRTTRIATALGSWYYMIHQLREAGLGFELEHRLLWGLGCIEEGLAYEMIHSFWRLPFERCTFKKAQWQDFVDTTLATLHFVKDDSKNLNACFYCWNKFRSMRTISQEERHNTIVKFARRYGRNTQKFLWYLPDLIAGMTKLGIDSETQGRFLDFIFAEALRTGDTHALSMVDKIFTELLSYKDTPHRNRVFEFVFIILKVVKSPLGLATEIIFRFLSLKKSQDVEENLALVLKIISGLSPDQIAPCLESMNSCLNAIRKTYRYGQEPYLAHLKIFDHIVTNMPGRAVEKFTQFTQLAQAYPDILAQREAPGKLLGFLDDPHDFNRVFFWPHLNFETLQGYLQGIYGSTMPHQEALQIIETHGWNFYLELVRTVIPFTEDSAALSTLNTLSLHDVNNPLATQIAYGEKILAIASDVPQPPSTKPVSFKLVSASQAIDPRQKDGARRIRNIFDIVSTKSACPANAHEARDNLVEAVTDYATAMGTTTNLNIYAQGVLKALVRLAVWDKVSSNISVIVHGACPLKYNSYFDLVILERLFTDEYFLRSVFLDAFKDHSIISATNLINQLRTAWNNPACLENRDTLVESILAPFDPQDITSKILADNNMEPELREVITEKMPKEKNNRPSTEPAKIIMEDIFQYILAAIKDEKALYTEVNATTIDLSLGEVSGLSFAFNGWTTGLCTADDVTIYKNARLLALKCPSRRSVVGISRFTETIIDGHRTLVLIDINSFPEFAEGVNRMELFHQWIMAIKEFAKENGFTGGVLLSAQNFIHSNDPVFQMLIAWYQIERAPRDKRRRSQRRKIAPVEWSSNAKYHFEDTIVL